MLDTNKKGLQIPEWVTSTLITIAVLTLIIGVPGLAIVRDKQARDATHAYANKRFVELQCQRGHYVASKYNPVMVYNCNGGEYTFEALLEEGRRLYREGKINGY
jgi:hypothetical protein